MFPCLNCWAAQNKGGNNANERLAFAAQPGQSFRLVNNATGQVVGEARTPEEISSLVAQSNALSKQLGKKADLSFEQSTGGAYSPIFEDQPNILFDTPMKLIAAGMLASTAGGLLQPGGLGGAGATGVTGAPVATTAGSVGATGTTAAGATGSGAGLLSAAAPGIFEAAPIIVTAGGSNFVLPSIAALTTVGGAATAGLTGGAATPSTPATTNAVETPLEVGPEIIATAPAGVPPALLTVPAAAAGVAGAAGGVSPTSPEVVQSPDLTVTAQPGTSVLPPFVPTITVPPGILPPSTTPTTPTDKTPPSKKDNVLGTGLSLTELLTLGSLGVSGLSTLFGGAGGGAGTTGVPYVSPFGATGGFGTGMDYRAQPSIADYERYGFGPEAAFFRPEYSGLVSRAAGFTPSTTQAASGSGTTKPVYQPLIGPGPTEYMQGGSNPNALKPGDIMTKGLESIFSQYGSQNQPMAAPGGSWDFYNRQRQQQQMFEAANPGLVLRDGMTSDEFEKYMQARDAFDRSATQTNAGSSQAPAGAETVVRGLLG
jgi:hypothetical protein